MKSILCYSDSPERALELLESARALTGDAASSVAINDEDLATALCARGSRVYRVRDEKLIFADHAGIARVVGQAARAAGASIVMLASDRRGKPLAGMLAQAMGAGCLTDVRTMRGADGAIVCERMSLGGATIAEQEIPGPAKVIALVPRAYAAAAEAPGGEIIDLETQPGPSKVTLVETRAKEKDGADIEGADTLVAVGMGLKNREDLSLVQSLAHALGAATGCSKPLATDRKWMPEDRIIGLSGKKCAPNLAFLVGVSAQVQFAAGIRDAGTIVSINTDENAPSAKMADYFIIGDLYRIVPELVAKLKA
ncbi:MAG: electron transfer flavoprotein subunit alpha/FixB family protein [Spirochaetes bacterium]|nr:MAG: electron transfer flavoprotein subunit alpha/FixB family protein [Spirochaetota bacterium]